MENIKLIDKLCDSKIISICSAVWNEDGILSFSSGMASSSTVSEDSANIVSSQKIDSVTECKEATFIKMDIEGSEYNALLGAYSTIKKKPS